MVNSIANMNIEFLQSMFADKLGFWLFQGVLLSIFIYAFLKDNIFKERSPVSAVHRGGGSRTIIISSASAFLTFVVSVVFSISSYPQEGKVVLYLLDLLLVIYLFFYSGWFTNKIIVMWNKFKDRNLNPHGR